LGIKVSSYLGRLDKRTVVGGVKITLVSVAYLTIFLIFMVYLSRIVRKTLASVLGSSGSSSNRSRAMQSAF